MQKIYEDNVNEGVSGDSLSLIEQLPTELLQWPIAQYLSNADLYRLSQASKTMFFAYREPLEKKVSQTLLSHVIKGEEAEALKMIDAKPCLLLIPSQAIDYSGRSYKGVTCFQAALLCHDVTLWKKIEPYFGELTNGQEEKASQFKALFPEGLPKQEPYDFSALIKVISESSDADITAALKKENNDTPICRALMDFRAAFTDLAMKETFFNPLHLIEALSVYGEQFDHWSWKQRDLFWRQVIGYTQRFLPASYAQASCQGLYSVAVEKMPLRRSLKLLYDEGSYFPLAEPELDSVGLGFDFGYSGVAWGEDGTLVVGVCYREWQGAGTAPLINYVEQIQQSYLGLSIACGMMDNPSQVIGQIL